MTTRWVLWAAWLATASAYAAEPTKEALENKFVATMRSATLEGFFSIDGRDSDKPPKDKYTIESVAKIKDGKWLVTARMQYFNVDLKVPVPVDVAWAGDTAVIMLTDVSLPGMTGKFSTRLLIDGDRYAGTWSHDKVGGHMWGRIKKTPAEKK
jgi:hypothetical protein